MINNVDGEEQYAFFVDSNQHSDLLIYKDGTNKVRFNTYWPGSIQNDNYATRGALVLGTDLGTPSQAASNNRYGIYVSGGPDSGSAYFDENVKIGGGPGTAPTERLEIHGGGRIKVTPGSDATGSILSLANDHDVLFSSQNDSATGDPQQFVIQHNDGGTDIINRRGDLILSASGDITLDADGTDITLKDGGTSFGSFKRASSDFIIKAETADKDILFKGTDDSSTITALTLDMSEAGSATFNNHITASGNLEVAGQISGSSTSKIEVGGAITASGGILLGSGKSISDADAPASYYLDPSGNSRVNNLTTVGPTTTIGGDLSVTSGTGSFEYIQTSKNISGSGLFHTFGGVVNTDEVRSITQTTNKLILEDDQSLATNMVSLMSVNHVNIISDGNNNGTGKVRILDGNYDVDSTTEVAEFSPEAIELHAPITASGNLEVVGNISGSLTSTGSFGSLVVSDKVQGNLTIDGTLFATKKSFLVNRPEGGKLEYGVLEGPQHDVFFRGELKGDNVIHLPMEWEWLVDENTITTQLTSIGKHQDLYVKEIKDNKIFIDINGVFKTKENIHCYHIVHGTRKDIELIRNHQ